MFKVAIKYTTSRSYEGMVWHLSHHFMANRWEKKETVTDFIFLDSKIMVTSAMKLEDACSLKEKL